MDQDGDVPEVRPPTIDDVRRVCRALEEAGARYVLIGGFAVIAACGVTWSEAQSSAERIDLDGTPVVVADRQTLIRTKQTLRPSDAADRAWLEAPGSR